MILEGFLQALYRFSDPVLWVWIFAGAIVGLIFGIIPGIGGLTACSLFLPFVFYLPAYYALGFMIAVQSTVFTGGGITSIVIGVPGTGPNAATLLDGFPMAQKGEGGRALGAQLTASGAGSVVSGLLALAMIPLVLPIVLAFRSAEMVFIILLGLAFIVTLSRGGMVKGLMSGGLGLIVSFVGSQIITGVDRFTFGSIYLYNGIPLIPAVMGLFAIPQAIDIAVKGGIVQKGETVIKGLQQVWEGAKDVFRHWGVFLRGTIIGYIFGLIPGVGAEAAVFVAYSQAKQTSKHPEKFGTGIVEGVIAPESADNAKEGGALLTTLSLGIPGGLVMAINLSALLILGLTPGPQMLTEHLDLTLNLMYIIVVAGIIGSVICLPLAPYLGKIAIIPVRVLFPSIVTIVFVGAFAGQKVFTDIVVMLVFGGVGLAIRHFGYNAPALLLGFVLGELFERYFFLALRSTGPFFFLRPICLVLIFMIIAILSFDLIRRLLQRRRKGEAIRP